jgi:hypothetical protein
MSKSLFSILTAIMFCLSASSQTVIHINSGSRASYGTYQNLLIDINAQVSYQKREVNGAVKDSLTFSISKSQLDSIFAKAEQNGFFQLNNKYDGGFADGAGIMIAINSSGKIKTVHLLNTDVPQINELVALINRMLEPQKIRIYYGQSVRQN